MHWTHASSSSSASWRGTRAQPGLRKGSGSTQHPGLQEPEDSHPAPIALPDPPTRAASEPRTLSKVMHCFCGQSWGEQCSSLRPLPHPQFIPSPPGSSESRAEAGECCWAPPEGGWGDRSLQGLRKVDFISTLMKETELPGILSPALNLCLSFLS